MLGFPKTVIPAQAGIHTHSVPWIPVSAGMTRAGTKHGDKKQAHAS